MSRNYCSHAANHEYHPPSVNKEGTNPMWHMTNARARAKNAGSEFGRKEGPEREGWKDDDRGLSMRLERRR